MDDVRRLLLKCIAAVFVLPALAFAKTWDELGCICRKIGAHWTICRKHWKDSTDDDFREHLKATHGHAREYAWMKTWPREQIMKLHNVHHDGGTFSYRGFTITIKKPSKGRHLS